MITVRLERRRYLLATVTLVVEDEGEPVVAHAGALHEMRALAEELAAEHGLASAGPGLWTDGVGLRAAG